MSEDNKYSDMKLTLKDVEFVLGKSIDELKKDPQNREYLASILSADALKELLGIKNPIESDSAIEGMKKMFVDFGYLPSTDELVSKNKKDLEEYKEHKRKLKEFEESYPEVKNASNEDKQVKEQNEEQGRVRSQGKRKNSDGTTTETFIMNFNIEGQPLVVDPDYTLPRYRSHRDLLKDLKDHQVSTLRKSAKLIAEGKIKELTGKVALRISDNLMALGVLPRSVEKGIENVSNKIASSLGVEEKDREKNPNPLVAKYGESYRSVKGMLLRYQLERLSGRRGVQPTGNKRRGGEYLDKAPLQNKEGGR